MGIGRKIYYEKLTGNFILDTGERNHGVSTTVEQDFEFFTPLSERNPETVDFIQLEYGQYAQDFIESRGNFRVNPTTKELEFSYPDPNEPEAPPVYQKPLSEDVKEIRLEMARSNAEMFETMIMMMGG